MKKNTLYYKGLLTAIREREAGSMTTPEGREVSWDAGTILYMLPEGTERGSISKYVIHPKCVKDIQSKTADVGWGALCQIAVDDGNVTDIEVISDSFSVIDL